MSSDNFFDNIKARMLDKAFEAMTEKAHGAAASIVDPVTGRHADVFVTRTGDTGLSIRTKGSPEFARLLERRLGVEQNSIKTMDESVSPPRPCVYLAHASEDHQALAKPLAERLLAEGVDVWLDAWEIRTGDSLRRRMEEGLGACTHFIVLLTNASIGKPWVETEIDAGFMRAVEGSARFVGLRVGTSVDQLSIFLRTVRCPAFDLDDKTSFNDLVGDLFDISKKPPLGQTPRYVQTLPQDTGGWSASAYAIARYLVQASARGCKFDPQVNVQQIATATGLPLEDVRLGLLDLEDAGLIEYSASISSSTLWPLPALFIEFDSRFLDFDNARDAVAIANWLLSQDQTRLQTDKLIDAFPSFSERRLNSALNYLEGSKAVRAHHYMGCKLTYHTIEADDRTRRFVKNRP